MTYRISKTVLDRHQIVDFAARAAAHAVALKEWRAHMAKVKEDESRAVPAIDRHMAYPQPRDHELVEAAVNENDEMDYELVDDGPTPEQTLRARKNILLNLVAGIELAAISEILPPGRARLYAMRDNAIVESDNKVAAELYSQRQNEGILKTLKSKVGLGDEPVDIPAEIRRRRTADDSKHLEEQQQRRARIQKVHEAAAQVLHDIEDLTADNIDDWKAPDFKGI